MSLNLVIRKFYSRLVLAVLPCLLLTLIYIVFGPIEIVCGNSTFLQYSYLDILVPILTLGLGVFILLLITVAFMKGRFFVYAVSVVFGFSIASYVQANYLNINFGLLDGTSINWSAYTSHAILNLGVWIVILFIPFVTCYFSKKLWKHMVCYGSALVITMQLIGIIFQVFTTPIIEHNAYLSEEERFSVASNSNIILFLLDNLSNECAEQIILEYPNLENELTDFTYYNNANCRYRVTYPGILAWLTGGELNMSIPTKQTFSEAWQSPKSETFYRLLKENRYSTNIYAELQKIVYNPDDVRNTVDNLVYAKDKSEIQLTEFFNLIKLTGFRSLPHIMKASFEVESDDIASIVIDSEIPTMDFGSKVLNEFLTTNLTVVDEQNKFIVHYLTGCHAPFNVDENGQKTDFETDEVRQGAGYMMGVCKYIEELKRLNVYDKATIIISADHGAWDRPQFAFFIKEPNSKHDSMKISSAPISPQEDLIPTLIRIINKNVDNMGTSIYDYSDCDLRERESCVLSYNENYPSVDKMGTKTKGGYNVLNVYRYIGDRLTLNQMVKDREISEIIPLADSIY